MGGDGACANIRSLFNNNGASWPLAPAPILEECRDLIEMYKMSHEIYDPVTTRPLYNLSSTNIPTRAHSFKLTKTRYLELTANSSSSFILTESLICGTASQRKLSMQDHLTRLKIY